MSVFRALALSVGQLCEPRMLGIFVRSLIVTLVIFAGLGIGLGFVLRGVDPCGLLSDGDSCPLGTSASGFGALLLTIVALWLLFPAVAIGVMSAYMDRVIAIVEERHYPAEASRARAQSWMSAALLGVRSSARLLVYNLVALPFYLLLLVTGVGTLLLFVAVNGIALGRDLGEMVAARHLDRGATRSWLSASRSDRAILGMVAAGLFMLPGVNLLAPLLAAAMATHVFHAQLRSDDDRRA